MNNLYKKDEFILELKKNFEIEIDYINNILVYDMVCYFKRKSNSVDVCLYLSFEDDLVKNIYLSLVETTITDIYTSVKKTLRIELKNDIYHLTNSMGYSYNIIKSNIICEIIHILLSENYLINFDNPTGVARKLYRNFKINKIIYS